MGAVWMRVRADLRARWRAAVALALIVGIAGGIVIALAAAARRTDSAYPRMLRAHDAVDVFEFNSPDEALTTALSPAELTRIEGVERFDPITFTPIRLGEDTFIPAYARASDPFAAGALDRFKVVEGRAFDHGDPTEVVLTIHGLDQARAHPAFRSFGVGSTFPLKGFDVPEFAAYARALARARLEMRVVGVVAGPGLLPPQVGEIAPYMFMTPEFFRRFPNAFEGVPPSYLVRLEPGTTVAAFRARVESVRGNPSIAEDRRAHAANVQHGLHLQALAIWSLAGVAAVAVLLVVGQTVVRQVRLDAADNEALAAVGASPAQLATAGTIAAAIPLAAGAAIAAGLAVLLSPLAPRGLARVAEPDPGLSADPLAIGAGVAALLVFLVGAAAICARGRGLVRRLRDRAAARPSFVAGALAGAGLSVGTGALLAFEPGRGSRAVPVRTTIAGVTMALLALSAAMTFDASLRRLIDEPARHGVPWDVIVAANDGIEFPGAPGRLGSLDGVRGFGIGGTAYPFSYDGVPVETTTFDLVSGTLGPVALEGRAPRPAGAGPVEVLLGSRTMRALGVEVGDAVAIGLALGEGTGAEPVDGVVVGRGLVPSANATSRLAEGALMSAADAVRLVPRRFRAFAVPDHAFIDLEPGTDREGFLERLAQEYTPDAPFDEDLYLPPIAKPNELVSFARVQDLPVVLAGLLAALCAAILAHTLVSSVRRRRADLAILKTLGFERGQVRRAVAIQATMLIALSIVVSLPSGIATGRWLWQVFAAALGVPGDPAVPLGRILLVVPVGVVLANVIAALPARAAARTRPAVVLRTE